MAAEEAMAGEEAPAKENGEVKSEEKSSSSLTAPATRSAAAVEEAGAVVKETDASAGKEQGDAMEVDEEAAPAVEKQEETANAESKQEKTESSAKNGGGANNHEHMEAQPGVASGVDEQAPAKPHPEGDMMEDQERSGSRFAQDTSASLSHVPGPLTPAFLLQLIKLLRRKEVLLEKARQHNDALQALKQPPKEDSEKTEEVSAEEKATRIPVVQREYAWCVVQVDRTNFQLRNALWGVALGMYGSSASSSSLGASLQGSACLPKPGDLPRDGASDPDSEPILKQCQQAAGVLLQAVTSSADAMDDDNDIISGSEPVQPLVGHCLSLLLLLRHYEEFTAAGGGAGGLAGGGASRLDWDAAFDKVLADIKPAAADNLQVYQEIVLCVETLRQSVEA